VAYLITFASYGYRLHSGESGSVGEEEVMHQAPYDLDQVRREAVLAAIQEVCAQRGWSLLAAHVRSNHVHTVVEAEIPPERVMIDFKAYADSHLNLVGLDEPGRKRWARDGTVRWLWNRHDVAAAIQYVVWKQGERMSVFESQEL
jgi:REP element-mobilizing transposase RayT